ncbi:SAF domain-containing protein [Aestuariimicrobium sp. T2.26MG-19.2B]|uniref:SAF domain-containing protein n=1 Tax=Aestuariimicrobium sp. T2.26MG-19.2B TaxID=3040679 RepID=UPI002477767B|nr:SAF domain-containing protein [Aestuariimicrobium sp. T2.26MG-19.2B]CAI9400903.1 hypothetical protein AESSP_00485 [Aestuariimicrobium sp. T2.26MG-19.2B]
MTRLPDLARTRDSFVAALRWHRRTLAALAVGLAVLSALSVLRPDPPPTTTVVVSARDLPAGTHLSRGDLRLVEWPDVAAPPGAPTSVDQVAGRVLVIALPRGTALIPGATLGERSAGAGQVLVPFRLSDPAVASLLRVGDVVNVVAQSADGEARTIATSARVSALVADAAATGPLGGGVTASDEGVVVIATDPATAERVAAASSSEGLSVTLGAPS